MKKMDVCELEMVQGGSTSPAGVACGVGVGMMIGSFWSGVGFAAGAVIAGLFCLTGDSGN